MTYVPNVPLSTSTPATDVSQIQTNFSKFSQVFSHSSANVNYNHTALNDDNQGDHEAALFHSQNADPSVTGNYVALYAKSATSHASTQPQLFFKIPTFLPDQFDSNAAQNSPMQLTYNQVNTSGPVYQSFLPGGYLIYFGSVSSIASPITLSPAPTKILMAIATPNNLTSVGTPIPFSVATAILNNSQFQISSTTASGSYTFGWVAIAQA